MHAKFGLHRVTFFDDPKGKNPTLNANLQQGHTYPYVLLHCEITTNVEKVNEPILERIMIALIGEIKIFSKSRTFGKIAPPRKWSKMALK